MATVAVGAQPEYLAAAGNDVYVANVEGDSVSVISTASNTVVATVPFSYPVTGLAASPNGAYVYASEYTLVAVISTSTNTVTTTVPINHGATGALAVTPNGNYVYEANTNASSVSVISTATNTVSATITTPSNPEHLVASADGARIYVADSGGVSVISTSTNAITSTVANVYGALAVGPASSISLPPAPAAPTDLATATDNGNGNDTLTITITPPTVQASQNPLKYWVFVNSVLCTVTQSTTVTQIVTTSDINNDDVVIQIWAQDSYGDIGQQDWDGTFYSGG